MRVAVDCGNEANSARGGVAPWESRHSSREFSEAVSALGAGAAELVVGAVPGALEGGDLALDAEEEFGGGGLGEEDGGEGVIGRFGHDGAEEIGLDGFEAALLPIGADHGIDVEGFGGGLGVVLDEVLGDERVVDSPGLRRG